MQEFPPPPFHQHHNHHHPVLESPLEPANRSLRLLGACENAYFSTSFKLVGSMAFPNRKETTNMAQAFPDIGYHISGKESIRGEKVGISYLGACEVAQSLQARLAGSHGF